MVKIWSDRFCFVETGGSTIACSKDRSECALREEIGSVACHLACSDVVVICSTEDLWFREKLKLMMSVVLFGTEQSEVFLMK